MIKIENLHKCFQGLEVLKGIDLQIKEGEVIAVIGPSGTGKSTLLRCMNYLEVPDEGSITIGEVTVDTKSISKQNIRKLRAQSAMVFQNYNLFANMTVLQNVMEPMLHVQKLGKQESEKRAIEFLKRVGLEEKAKEYPSRISGGQQQRVAIARAMAVNPKIILFDEPTSALDPELIGEVLGVIRRLVEEHRTMLIVTHEMAFAQEAADRIVFLSDGQIVEEGTPNEIFDHPSDERLKRFLNKINC